MRLANAGCSWHGLRASFRYSQHAPNMARFTSRHDTADSSKGDETHTTSCTRDSQDDTAREELELEGIASSARSRESERTRAYGIQRLEHLAATVLTTQKIF